MPRGNSSARSAKGTSADIAGQIVEMLTPVSSEERHRIISAALILLGEKAGATESSSKADLTKGDAGTGGLPARALAWMKQNELTRESLDQVFHISEGSVDVIASDLPGKGQKSMTLNAYVLMGIARLLASGETTFADKDARALCKSLGCYNDPNHSAYMKAKGNLITGSKAGGWVLTAPGLGRGAALIREMIKLA